MKSGENDRKKGGHVGSIILHTVTGYGFLSAGILIAVVGAVVLALIPPLVLGDIVDGCFVFYYACDDRYYGIGKGGTSHRIWTEDNTCCAKQPHGKAHKAVSG